MDTVLDVWGLMDEIDPSSEYGQDTIEYKYAPDGLQQGLKEPFLKWCSEYPKNVDHDAWLAMISNLLPYGEEGVRAIHNLSSLDPSRYNSEATSKKIIGCQGMKPITYQWILANTNFPGTDEKVGYKSPAAAGVRSAQNDDLPVFEENGAYWLRISAKVTKKLTNFTLIPISEVSVNGQTERIYDIYAKGKIIKNIAITSGTLSNSGELTKFMLNQGRLHYYGEGKQSLAILDFLEENYQNVKQLNGHAVVGLHQESISGIWTVLTQKKAWDKSGVNDKITYFNSGAKKQLVHDEIDRLKDKELDLIKKKIFMFNNMAITGTVVGWMCAVMVAKRMRTVKSLRMPCLIIHGQAGCGKTQMTKVVMQKFFGDLEPSRHVGDVTKFVYNVTNASSNMFPIFYDEYKPSKWRPYQKNLVSEAIRGTYDGNITSRGRADLTTTDYAQIAPAVYIGEEGFTETALVERSVEVFMSKEESFQYTDSFLEMKDLPMMAFGNSFLNWTLTMEDSALVEIWQKEEITNRNADRPIHNTSMIRFGLELLSKYFTDKGSKLITAPLKEAVSQAQAVYTDEYGTGTRSAVDFIIEAMITMMDGKILSGYEIKLSVDESKLFINVREAFPKFRKWAKETEYSNEMVSESEFNKQIRKMDYFEGKRAARMGYADKTTIKTARVLSINKLINAGLWAKKAENVVD
jgi:hypothetical protein